MADTGIGFRSTPSAILTASAARIVLTVPPIPTAVACESKDSNRSTHRSALIVRPRVQEKHPLPSIARLENLVHSTKRGRVSSGIVLRSCEWTELNIADRWLSSGLLVHIPAWKHQDGWVALQHQRQHLGPFDAQINGVVFDR